MSFFYVKKSNMAVKYTIKNNIPYYLIVSWLPHCCYQHIWGWANYPVWEIMARGL